MAVDTPARIAVLGAGPIGLEAGLYGRSLGYEVDIYERGRVAQNVMRWGHVRMFSPFRLNRSPLGLAALKAQNPRYQPPNDDEILTGRDWAQRYLLPLAKTDLLDDSIHEETTVLSVGRAEAIKTDLPGDPQRGNSPFRILLGCSQSRQRTTTADIVIDTRGVFGNANWLGRGGMPAVGEREVRSVIESELPELAGDEGLRYTGRRTLLIGSGYSAATNIVALSRLAREQPQTSVVWLTRRECRDPDDGPVARIPHDSLEERDRLAQQANEAARRPDSGVTHWPGTAVEEIQYDKQHEQFTVLLTGQHAGQHQFDRIISNVGYRPDHHILDELQVHLCYATDGPIKLAAALLGQASADCLDQTSCGPQTLMHPEVNFYILGAQSYGRNSRFLVSVGLQQIRELFTIIAGRETLDLYSSVKNLLD